MLNRLILPCLLFVLSLTACSQEATSADNSGGTGSAKPVLVFFLDPNGGPCRMQADILQKLPESLQNRVDLRLVQTTVPDDRQLFYQYGIRGLPSLVLTDPQGQEIKRLPPGVQNARAIEVLLTGDR